jgi:hypothetical protein
LNLRRRLSRKLRCSSQKQENARDADSVFHALAFPC